MFEEHAFVDLSAFRKVRVSGSDAAGWLNDLLAADLSRLAPGRSVRSLLLTPTGRTRADVTVAVFDQAFLLLQAPEQPEHIGLALSPYILSSDVIVSDATNELALFAVPGKAAERVGHPGVSPSVLGKGVDLLVGTGKPAWRLEDALVKSDLEEAGRGAVDTWRIRLGRPRMGQDFDQTSLPSEAGLEDTIGWEKGCFLGQESAAKVRNLGHPPTVLLHVVCDGRVFAGETVLSGAKEAGRVTSAAPLQGRSYAIAKIGWNHAASALTLVDGRPLARVPKVT